MVRGQASHWSRQWGSGKKHTRPPMDVSQRKKRKCLMHGGDFLSDGPGHRVCNSCKASPEWKRGLNENTPDRTGGRVIPKKGGS